MELRREDANKVLCHKSYHFYDESRQYPLVGSVWQEEKDGPWGAHCTMGVEEGLYGHLGDFDNYGEALDCLKRRVAGDKTAKGKDSD